MKLAKLVKDEVKDTSYLKLVENKTHKGPVSEEKVARAKAAALSAAANKVRVVAGFTVKVEKPETEEDSKRSNARSLLFIDIGESPAEVVKSSIYIMESWARKYSEAGTPDYLEKLTRYTQAQAKAYAAIGFNGLPVEKPNLTKDQKDIYNSIVGPTGFDYYEYHLALKLEGQKKFERTKTFRSLRPLDIKGMLVTLSSTSKSLASKIILDVGKTN